MIPKIWPAWYSPIGRVPVSDVVALASALSGISTSVIKGKTRFHLLVRVRHAIAIVAVEIGHGIAHTGRCMDRDHTTILNSIEKGNILIERDAVFAAFVSKLREAVMVRRPVALIKGERVFASAPARALEPAAAKPEPQEEDEIEMISRQVAAHLASRAA